MVFSPSLCVLVHSNLSTSIHVHVEIQALQKTTERKWPKPPKGFVVVRNRSSFDLKLQRNCYMVALVGILLSA